jgi:hypothetical protein
MVGGKEQEHRYLEFLLSVLCNMSKEFSIPFFILKDMDGDS